MLQFDNELRHHLPYFVPSCVGFPNACPPVKADGQPKGREALLLSFGGGWDITEHFED
jgi:hypothetical protein